MDTKTFIIATNGRLKWWLQHTLEDLSPEQLDYRTPLIDDRPIAEVAMLDTLLAQVDEVVSGLSESDLDKEVTFPWGQQQAGDALSAALTHALTHAGGIAGIRAIGGFPVPPGY